MFEKNRNDPHVIFVGLGEDDSGKKPEAKNVLTLSFYTKHFTTCGKVHFDWVVAPKGLNYNWAPLRGKLTPVKLMCVVSW
jgi:hypothetical protein